jgi:hypothetical protein
VIPPNSLKRTRPRGSRDDRHVGPAIVSSVVLIALAFVIATVFVSSERLSSSAQPHWPPPVSPEDTLLVAYAQDVFTLYQGNFTVPDLYGPDGQVPVETAAAVNITCGAMSPYLNLTYSCLTWLISGPIGGPTANYLWTDQFNGNLTTQVSFLTPGLYWFMVHAEAGTAPGVILVVPLQVTAEVEIVSADSPG